VITETIETHRTMVDALQSNDIDIIAAIADMITSALKQNATVYICGNGGSAADAQHIAAELVGRFCRERRALAAVALTTDTSTLTSIANDYTFKCVFERQVDALVREGDILWAFSTSGTSENIIAAVKLAKEKGAGVIAFTGKANSMLERMADLCFCADSKSTARSQEIHQLVYHIICDIVESNFSDNREGN
jgi:D-sedoheptulose 7-phosphate isomerase